VGYSRWPRFGRAKIAAKGEANPKYSDVGYINRVDEEGYIE
jgi:hypothetical protein